MMNINCSFVIPIYPTHQKQPKTKK
jgi:hypothetical protein